MASTRFWRLRLSPAGINTISGAAAIFTPARSANDFVPRLAHALAIIPRGTSSGWYPTLSNSAINAIA